MTDKRKIWYEWYAESFLSILGATSPSGNLAGPLSTPTQFNGLPGGSEGMRSSLLSPGAQSPGLSALSPMLDAPQPLWEGNLKFIQDGVPGLVKIGQTSLHNPGGRSSWIGL